MKRNSLNGIIKYMYLMRPNVNVYNIIHIILNFHSECHLFTNLDCTRYNIAYILYIVLSTHILYIVLEIHNISRLYNICKNVYIFILRI